MGSITKPLVDGLKVVSRLLPSTWYRIYYRMFESLGMGDYGDWR